MVVFGKGVAPFRGAQTCIQEVVIIYEKQTFTTQVFGHMEGEFRMKNDRLFLKVPDGDRKKRPYQVVAAKPLNRETHVDSSATKPAENGLSLLEDDGASTRTDALLALARPFSAGTIPVSASPSAPPRCLPAAIIA
jgi:hypothetical protein